MSAFEQQRRLLLQQLKKDHAYRSRLVCASPQQNLQNIAGKNCINFAGNDYLGLANHPLIKQAFKQGVDDFGVGSGAAHLINGHSQAHHALELELAEFCNRPRALLFSSGYMANLAVLTTLYNKNVTVFQDKLNHASLIDAGQNSQAQLKRYKHKDLNHLQQLINLSDNPQHAIVTDGVFSMDGDLAPLKNLVTLAKQYQAELMIDDAHGFGVLGKNGGGICQHLNLSVKDVPIYMATLGKAVGCFGAFVAGSETLIETLINNARQYIFTTATPPALAQAARQSLQLIKTEHWRREKLNDNIAYFKQYCAQVGVNTLPSDTAIQPIIIADKEHLLTTKQNLFNNGFLVGAVRPPTVAKNASRLRITLNTNHDVNQIKKLVEMLSDCL